VIRHEMGIPPGWKLPPIFCQVVLIIPLYPTVISLRFELGEPESRKETISHAPRAFYIR